MFILRYFLKVELFLFEIRDKSDRAITYSPPVR